LEQGQGEDVAQGAIRAALTRLPLVVVDQFDAAVTEPRGVAREGVIDREIDRLLVDERDVEGLLADEFREVADDRAR
jgi:hypothetical protein